MSLISIVIPTYNRAALLHRSVDSVIKQEYRNFEIIIIDDASDDATGKTVAQLQESNPDIEISYHRLAERSGAQAARNVGIKASHGTWIAFLDSDDEWYPKYLSTMVSYAEASGYPVVYCDGFIDDGTERKPIGINKGEGDIYKNILIGPGPMFQGLLVKMESLKKIDYLALEIRTYQEWDTVIRLSGINQIGYVSEQLFVWYTNNRDSISKDISKAAEGYVAIINKYNKEISKYAGQRILRLHYIIAAQKYFESKYFIKGLDCLKKAKQASDSLTTTCIISVQIFCLKQFALNPKYLNPDRYWSYITRFFSSTKMKI